MEDLIFQRNSHTWFQTMQSIMAGPPHMQVPPKDFVVEIIEISDSSRSIFKELEKMQRDIYLSLNVPKEYLRNG